MLKNRAFNPYAIKVMMLFTVESITITLEK
jgi:hypothetical protein